MLNLSIQQISQNTPWHAIPKEEVLKILKTNLDGLSVEEVKSRLRIYGKNILETYKMKSKIKIFLMQFMDYVVIILIIAAVISLALGEIIDSALIMLILTVNAIIGTYQEWKAEKAIVSLRKYVKLYTKVRRNGHVEEIPSEDLVPGDIVLIEQGSRVPADLRLIETINLMIDESLLTGESIPVPKDSDIVLEKETPVSDRINMAFAGSLVTYGYGVGVVVATGKNTEIGRIAELIKEIEVPETPLKKKTKELGKQMSNIFLIVTTAVFFQSLVKMKDIELALLTAVSLAVAAVPEGLPVFITLILALGGLEMAKRNAIVRSLRAVETLGSTTVICSDKTGTLTENQMTVVKIVTYNNEIDVTGSGYKPEGTFLLKGEKVNPLEFEDVKSLIIAGVLCNRAKIDVENGEYKVIGDPLEGALIVLGLKAGIDYENSDFIKDYVRIHELPFDSKRKRMSVIYLDKNGRVISFIKGSPESILEIATKVQINGEIQELTDDIKNYFIKKSEEMAEKALRVLAIGYKYVDHGNISPTEIKNITAEDVENDIILVGIVGMIDPPRSDSKLFIDRAKEAGIKVVMVTGDHALTAKSIAKQIGIIDHDHEKVLAGIEIDKMSEQELIRVVSNVKVFARVSPEAKVKIIKAFKKKGEITAMTGDGINDAPALKLADVGVAMGKRGTDVAREASDLILMDEKFPTIVKAIEVGRAIYDNIRKTILYLLSTNIAEILIIFFAFLFGWPLALLPVQILWMNLVGDGVPALGLCVDPPESDVMKRPPRDPKEPIIRRSDYFRLIYISTIITIITLGLYGYYLRYGVTYARTVVFTTVILMEFFNVINMRSEKESIFKIGFLTNKFLLATILIQFFLQLALIYIPLLAVMFHLAPLTIETLVIIIILSSIALISEEIRKYCVRNIS